MEAAKQSQQRRLHDEMHFDLGLTALGFFLDADSAAGILHGSIGCPCILAGAGDRNPMKGGRTPRKDPRDRSKKRSALARPVYGAPLLDTLACSTACMAGRSTIRATSSPGGTPSAYVSTTTMGSVGHSCPPSILLAVVRPMPLSWLSSPWRSPCARRASRSAWPISRASTGVTRASAGEVPCVMASTGVCRARRDRAAGQCASVA